ncbi:hypothetical protein BR93DRAFT_925310 [Coniochaeta sp. PMI_546]|nr:hypothetical protein BR93DRAFT_925310 [Coniochaeta sp. PMI_546]
MNNSSHQDAGFRRGSLRLGKKQNKNDAQILLARLNPICRRLVMMLGIKLHHGHILSMFISFPAYFLLPVDTMSLPPL